MPRNLQILIIVLSSLLFEISEAATIWVRPSTNAQGGALTYNLGDGSSYENAYAGFSSVTPVPGDTICLAGYDEPYFDRLITTVNGTSGNPISYRGCKNTPALFWAAQGINLGRSFNSSRVAVSNYDWVDDGNGLYHKKLDVRAEMMWENDLWLQPVSLTAGQETVLMPGQWGMSNPSGVLGIYYRASTANHNPTVDNIYINDVTTSNNPYVTRDVRINKNFIELKNIETRGQTGRGIGVLDASDVVVENVIARNNKFGWWISGDTATVNRVKFLNTRVIKSSWSGAYIQGGVQGVNSLTIDGGEYNYSIGFHYDGTNMATGDGDGIGIGQSGGTMNDLVVQNVDASYNWNAGIFVGTSEVMTINNLSMLGIRMIRNQNNCYAEGNVTAKAVGNVTLSGFLCVDTVSRVAGSAVRLATPASARVVTVTNGVFAGNRNAARIGFQPHANNTYLFSNLVFYYNGGASSGELGDIYSFATNLTGQESFKNIYLYSSPNNARRFATMNAAQTAYLYNDGAALAAFNTAANGTNNVINTDPKFLSLSDYRTKSDSPLRGSGFATPLCIDIHGKSCASTPDIGAYQSMWDTLAFPRPIIITPRDAASTRDPASVTREAR